MKNEWYFKSEERQMLFDPTIYTMILKKIKIIANIYIALTLFQVLY